MLQPGDQIMLSIDEDGTAGAPGTVEVCHDNGWTVEFEVEDFEPQAGRDAVMRFGGQEGFCQVPVRIEAVETIGFTLSVRLSPIAEPGPAEQRRHPRYSTVNSDAIISFGDEDGCPLLDVSLAGLSVMSGEPRTIGDTVVVRLERDGEVIEWPVVVRGVREVWEGRFRYGLECEHADVDPTKLLDRIGAAVE